MSFLPYPPPPEPGWYDDDVTVMAQPTAEPVDMGVLLGRKPSAEVPAGAKSVKLEDPTRTISRNHAAISFDQDGTLWIEDYGSLNGTYIIQDDVETKVEHKPMQLEAPCTVRIGDQFFQFRKQ